MRFDSRGLLITNEPEPGCFGDSLAETSRYGLIQLILRKPFGLVLGQFFTVDGIVVHPKSSIPAINTPDDQKLPLYLCAAAGHHTLLVAYKLWDRLWPLKEIIGLRLLIQALHFKLTSPPPEKYLNFAAQVFYMHLMRCHSELLDLALILVPREVIRAKVEQYYFKDQENSQWLVDQYKKAIDITWTSR